MKRFIKIQKWLMPALFLLVVGFLSSCSKDDHAVSIPEITGFRAIAPAPDDSTLTVLSPGQMVVVRGQHLSAAQEILFNGVPASINPALNTDETMIVTVPLDIDFDDLMPDMANKVTISNKAGSSVFDFTILPPPPTPVIVSVSNEFANAGESIVITGRNLKEIIKIILPDNTEITDGLDNPDLPGDRLEATLPPDYGGTDNVNEDNYIYVVTAGGTSNAYPFNNNKGVIADFDADGTESFGWAYWGGIRGNDASRFPGLRGDYIEVEPAGNIPAGDPGWWGDNRAVIIAPANQSWWESKGDAPSDYALKFQIYVKNEWTTGPIVIDFGGDNGAGFSMSYTPWESSPGKKFITDSWITVSLPLNLLKNGGGDMPANVGEITDLGGGDSHMVRVMLNNTGYDMPIVNYDAAFDLFRIVKVK